VRPRFTWMTRADDYILELLDNIDIAANPATIAYNIDYDNSYIGERCRVMNEYGLVDRVDEKRVMYVITDLGRRYLVDDLTPDEEAELEDMP